MDTVRRSVWCEQWPRKTPEPKRPIYMTLPLDRPTPEDLVAVRLLSVSGPQDMSGP